MGGSPNQVGNIFTPFYLQTPFPKITAVSFIMPDEFGEHLIRYPRPFLLTEHLQILQIPRSMLALLLFSSSHLLQGSGQGLGRPLQMLGFVLSEPFLSGF